mmetsp:Transcript_27939/g.82127  ORF Transcript_27939/g.82127 Transcript_27939/m.82127 type:complete len:481 (+) Transcript_27939:573-2015(+)
MPLANDPGSQALVPLFVVKDAELSRRQSLILGVETDVPRGTPRDGFVQGEGSSDDVRSVTYLDVEVTLSPQRRPPPFFFLLPVGTAVLRPPQHRRHRPPDPGDILDVKIRPRLIERRRPLLLLVVVSIRYDHGVPPRILRDDVPRTLGRFHGMEHRADAPSLSDGMIPQSIVPSDDSIVRGVQNVSGIVPQIRREEFVEFDLTEEAQPLRIGTIPIGQFEFGGESPYLGLEHVPQGEDDAAELGLSEGREEVRLILDGIGGAMEPHDRIPVRVRPTLLQTSVMSRGDVIEIPSLDGVVEASELDARIAHDVRIRSPSPPRVVDGVRYDPIPVLILQADGLEGHVPRLLAHGPAYGVIVLPRALTEVRQFVLEPDAEVERRDPVVLTEEEAECYGRVDPAREEHGDGGPAVVLVLVRPARGGGLGDAAIDSILFARRIAPPEQPSDLPLRDRGHARQSVVPPLAQHGPHSQQFRGVPPLQR